MEHIIDTKTPDRMKPTTAQESPCASPDTPDTSGCGRVSSLVQQKEVDGRDVFVKSYFDAESKTISALARARAAREIEVLEHLAQHLDNTSRLRSVQLVSAEPEQATLTTQKTTGETLQECLNGPFYSGRRPEGLRALWLAGRWLQSFQAMPTAEGHGTVLGRFNPPGLIEYCVLRLDTIRESDRTLVSPLLRDRLLDTLEHLLHEAPTNEKQPVWCHRDFAPVNILWDGRAIIGLDFAMSALDVPLLDASYFIHRLEMTKLYSPWKRWPVDRWKRAFLRGYGRAEADRSPMYRALEIRHLLCRLQTYVRRDSTGWKQRLHNTWVRKRVLAELARRVPVV